MNIPQLQNEAALLNAAAKGDDQAFSRLSDYYYQPLGLHIFRLTHSMEMAEEIIQDVFLMTWLSHEVLGGIKNFREFLYLISKNHSLKTLRKMAREEVIQKAYALSQVAIIEETSPAEELERKYYFLVNKAIGLLPDYQQKIYLLSRKMEYKEITVQMNIPYVTVKRCIQYSRLSISNYVRSHMEPCLIALLLATPVVDDVVYLN